MSSEDVFQLLLPDDPFDFSGDWEWSDWRNHIPCALIDDWRRLSPEARAAAYLTAKRAAEWKVDEAQLKPCDLQCQALVPVSQEMCAECQHELDEYDAMDKECKKMEDEAMAQGAKVVIPDDADAVPF